MNSSVVDGWWDWIAVDGRVGKIVGSNASDLHHSNATQNAANGA